MHEKANEFGFTRGGYGKGRGLNPPWVFDAQGRGISMTTSVGKVIISKKGEPKYLTYGNPPNRVLYNTAKELRAKILEIAREVYAND